MPTIEAEFSPAFEEAFAISVAWDEPRIRWRSASARHDVAMRADDVAREAPGARLVIEVASSRR